VRRARLLLSLLADLAGMRWGMSINRVIVIAIGLWGVQADAHAQARKVSLDAAIQSLLNNGCSGDSGGSGGLLVLSSDPLSSDFDTTTLSNVWQSSTIAGFGVKHTQSLGGPVIGPVQPYLLDNWSNYTLTNGRNDNVLKLTRSAGQSTSEAPNKLVLDLPARIDKNDPTKSRLARVVGVDENGNVVDDIFPSDSFPPDNLTFFELDSAGNRFGNPLTSFEIDDEFNPQKDRVDPDKAGTYVFISNTIRVDATIDDTYLVRTQRAPKASVHLGASLDAACTTISAPTSKTVRRPTVSSEFRFNNNPGAHANSIGIGLGPAPGTVSGGTVGASGLGATQAREGVVRRESGLLALIERLRRRLRERIERKCDRGRSGKAGSQAGAARHRHGESFAPSYRSSLRRQSGTARTS
jgi:hypothetical protein